MAERPLRRRAGAGGAYYGEDAGPITSRFDEGRTPFTSGYDSPGWRRAQASRRRNPPPQLEAQAELVATTAPGAAGYDLGERIFHQKFGYGRIAGIDGNKLTIDFEKAGRKRVIASFVERHGR